jgi:hypothetical protein
MPARNGLIRSCLCTPLPMRFYHAEATQPERSALPDNPRHPGLLQSQDTSEWLWDQQFSLVAGDNFAPECWPVCGPVGDLTAIVSPG